MPRATSAATRASPGVRSKMAANAVSDGGSRMPGSTLNTSTTAASPNRSRAAPFTGAARAMRSDPVLLGRTTFCKAVG